MLVDLTPANSVFTSHPRQQPGTGRLIQPGAERGRQRRPSVTLGDGPPKRRGPTGRTNHHARSGRPDRLTAMPRAPIRVESVHVREYGPDWRGAPAPLRRSPPVVTWSPTHLTRWRSRVWISCPRHAPPQVMEPSLAHAQACAAIAAAATPFNRYAQSTDPSGRIHVAEIQTGSVRRACAARGAFPASAPFPTHLIRRHARGGICCRPARAESQVLERGVLQAGNEMEPRPAQCRPAPLSRLRP